MPLSLPYAYGRPPLAGRLRVQPADFFVDEMLGYNIDGEGEHVVLHIEKRGANTQWVARQLAKFAGVPSKAVGFVGLKDRHALTRQYFSVQLPGRQEPDWQAAHIEGVSVLSSLRHRRKLKRGALAGNRFVLVVRDVTGDRAQADVIADQIARQGVPNYFGAQRFGRAGNNVEQALAMFAGQRVKRATRSILLSAARAQLFNDVLAERVRRECWATPLEGEVWCLAGSRSHFGPEAFNAQLQKRLDAGDIHPSGPLWGRGEVATTQAAHQLEMSALQPHVNLKAGLEKAGLEQARRPLRLWPQNLNWQWQDETTLRCEFSLPAGAYATVVLREWISS